MACFFQTCQVNDEYCVFVGSSKSQKKCMYSLTTRQKQFDNLIIIKYYI